MYYFAFGSNINHDHFRTYLEEHGVTNGVTLAPRRAVLAGHRLRTNYRSIIHEAGACTIEPAAGHTVEGVLFRITPEIHALLRRKEGYPVRYTEELVEVRIPGSHDMVSALTFIASPERRLLDDQPVTQAYRQIILDGAEANGLSQHYLTQLKAMLQITPTADA